MYQLPLFHRAYHCLLFIWLFCLTLSDWHYLVSSCSPLLALLPTQWLRPVLEPTAPITAAVAAAQPDGNSSAKRTFTFEGCNRQPPTMTWSSSANREYHSLLEILIYPLYLQIAKGCVCVRAHACASRIRGIVHPKIKILSLIHTQNLIWYLFCNDLSETPKQNNLKHLPFFASLQLLVLLIFILLSHIMDEYIN